jgi:hypothetical protein
MESEFAGLTRDAADIVHQCSERRPDVPVVLGIAVHEIEIWMLADPAARRAAFGPRAGMTELPSADLEGIPDPKGLWRTYSGQSPAPDGIRPELHHDQQRLAAWTNMRPDVVAVACTRGFAPFHDAARRLLRSAFPGAS